MISSAEKKLLHIYANAAGLSRDEYVAILRASAGLDSSAAPEFSHALCDAALIALESELYRRLDAGQISTPRSRHIRPRGHFAFQYRGKGRPNQATRRQIHRLDDLVALLSDYHPAASDRASAVASKACHRPVSGWSDLTTNEASAVISALQDVLTRAAALAAVPF